MFWQYFDGGGVGEAEGLKLLTRNSAGWGQQQAMSAVTLICICNRFHSKFETSTWPV